MEVSAQRPSLERILARLRARPSPRVNDTTQALGIGDLPNELIVLILLSMDGVTLLRARRVCRRWNAIICDILYGEILSRKHRNLIWHKICRDVMPDPILNQLMNKYGKPDSMLKPATLIDWKRIYSRGQACRAEAELHQMPTVWHKPESSKENIILAIRLSGDVVYTQYADGLVSAWCYKTNEEIPFAKLVNINNAEVVTFGDVYGSGPYPFTEEIFSNDHVMLQGSINGKITATSLTIINEKARSAVIFEVNYKPIEVLQVHGNWIFVGFRNLVIVGTLCPRNGNSSVASLPQLINQRSLNWRGDSISANFLWYSPQMTTGFKVIIADWPSKSVHTRDWTPTFFMSFGPSLSDSSFDGGESLKDVRQIKIQGEETSRSGLQFPEEVETFSLCSEKDFTKMKIFHGEVAIVLMPSNCLFISSAEDENYRLIRPQELWPSINSTVTAFNFFAGVLILGTDSGKIFAFRLKNLSDVKSMVFDKPIWSEIVDSHRTVDQIEVQTDEGLLTLAVAMGECVFLTQIPIGYD